ncbi:MAG: zinc-ribbon domain-containing protein [Planctomycetaceae bacterium]
MSEALVTACPHCGTKLKLKAEYSGKKVRCPKCQEPFVVEGATGSPRPQGKPPAAGSGGVKRPANPTAGKRPPVAKPKPKPKAADDMGFLDDLDDSLTDDFGDDDFGDDMGDDFGDEVIDSGPQTSRRKKAAGGKSKKKSKSGGGNGGKVALFIGGGILGLGLLGGVVWGIIALVSSLGGGFGNRMAFMPNDIDAFVEVRVADVWGSPVMQTVRDQPKMGDSLKEMQEATGLQPADIDRVAVGTNVSTKSSVIAVYTNKPFDRSTATDTADYVEVEHQGVKYLEAPKKDQAIYLPTSNIIVLGKKADVKKAIEIGNDSKAASNFASLPSSGHFIVAAKIPAGSVPPPSGGLNPFGALQTALGKVTEVTVTMQFTSDLVLNISAQSPTPEDAENFKTALSDGKGMAKGFLSGLPMSDNVDPAQAEAMEKAKQALDGLEFSASGNTTTVSATISGSLIEEGVKQSGGKLPGGLPFPSPGGFPSRSGM